MGKRESGWEKGGGRGVSEENGIDSAGDR
jgi:hypothetical protein